MVTRIQAFFISNTIVSNARLKLAKKKAKATQLAQDELLLLQNYVLFSSTYHPKIIGDILKNVQKTSTSIEISLYD